MYKHWTKKGLVYHLNSNPNIQMYIQPGGCVELYEIEKDEQEFAHFYNSELEALIEAVEIAKKEKQF